MKHLSQEELILHYYGEQEVAAAHLSACEECRRGYQVLQRTLNAVDALPVPERAADYESQIWQRIEKRLPAPRPKRSWWWAAPKWAAAAALVAVAFFVGRFVQRPTATARTGVPNERILLVAVGDHLERSQVVLAELANSEAQGAGKLDISYEQSTAKDLVESNRLYRQSANRAGDHATASLLDDLERVLLEIANSPAEVSEHQLDDLRREIKDEGLQFKVRVYQTHIQERDKTL
jgi:hypothetical protein